MMLGHSWLRSPPDFSSYLYYEIPQVIKIPKAVTVRREKQGLLTDAALMAAFCIGDLCGQGKLSANIRQYE